MVQGLAAVPIIRFEVRGGRAERLGPKATSLPEGQTVESLEGRLGLAATVVAFSIARLPLTVVSAREFHLATRSRDDYELSILQLACPS